MRKRNTYRSGRRNLYNRHGVRTLDKNFKRLDSKGKGEFDETQIRYNPPETSGYWPNREDLKHRGIADIDAYLAEVN